jgi:hypothetical protein
VVLGAAADPVAVLAASVCWLRTWERLRADRARLAVRLFCRVTEIDFALNRVV